MKNFITLLIILLLGIGGGIFLTKNFAPLSKVTNINITSSVKQILPTSEFVSLVYHYSDVITHSDAIKFFDFGNIPFTEKKAIYTIDGAIKLGINCKDLKINCTNNRIIINMPAIEIISHEIFPETFNLYDEKSGLFNRYTISDTYNIQATQRLEKEKKTLENTNIFEQARITTEEQFRRFLGNIPGINENYEIEFKWE